MTCANGTRAAAADRPRAASARTYELGCGADCVASAVVNGTRCRAVACQLPNVTDAAVDGGASDILHGDTAVIRCSPGFRLAGRVSSFSASCENATVALCDDGALTFGESLPLLPANAFCPLSRACRPLIVLCLRVPGSVRPLCAAVARSSRLRPHLRLRLRP